MTWQRSPKTSSTSSAVTMSAGAPSAIDRAVAQGDEVGGVPGRVVEVVQHRDQGAALLLVQLGAQVEHVDLVLDVEVRGRLVEQQQRGLLGERHRDPHALPLAAGQFVDIAIGEFGDAGGGHRLLRRSARPRVDHWRSRPWCG